MKRLLATILAATLALGAQAQTLVRPLQGGTGVSNPNAAILTRSGAHALTFTTTGTTSLTLPTSGTLAILGANTFTGLQTFNAGATIASGQTLTLTGATVAGAPTWSSSQAITLSTAAQPNVTSLGTLTELTVAGSALSAVLRDTAAYGAAEGPALLFYGKDSGSTDILFGYVKGLPSAGGADRGFVIIGGRVDGVNTTIAQFGTGVAGGTSTLNTPLTLGSNSLTAGAISGTSLLVGNGVTALKNVSTGIGLRVGVGVDTSATAGAGLEISTTTASSQTELLFYDRTGAAYYNAKYRGLSHLFDVSGSTVANITSTGFSVNGAGTFSGSATSNVLKAAATSNGDRVVLRPNASGNGGDVFAVDYTEASEYRPLNILGSTIKFYTGTSGSSYMALIDTNGILSSGYYAGAEQGAPAAPAANGYRIFAQDNGAGKTQLMVIFASGAAQQIAIEP